MNTILNRIHLCHTNNSSETSPSICENCICDKVDISNELVSNNYLINYFGTNDYSIGKIN